MTSFIVEQLVPIIFHTDLSYCKKFATARNKLVRARGKVLNEKHEQKNGILLNRRNLSNIVMQSARLAIS